MALFMGTEAVTEAVAVNETGGILAMLFPLLLLLLLYVILPAIIIPTCIASGRRKRAAAQRAAEATRGWNAQSGSMAAPTDDATVIEQLVRLHEQGLLTDAEFSAKKAEVLARM